ncbi:MAG: tetratricopeptide repeat protein [Thermaceae bacterium]|nr:tetratricopeptide repeat protein [Thermaceae bacterium]
MRLRTLGGLELVGSNLRRGAFKPLLLLAYLALEGPKPRRFLAELFWPEAADPMNSLKVVLHRLRQLEAIFADEERAWTMLECDALELREHLRTNRLSEAVNLYSGAFLEGAEGDSGEELEDWIYTTREATAREVRAALLELAQREAAGGHFAEAASSAEAAYRLAGAPPPEPEELPRFFPLLLAGGNPLAEAIKREAHELGLELALSAEVARGRLRQSFVGRVRELEKLMALRPGEWAWLRGGAGMGKTALLRRLEAGATYLPARSGLPYATLEPLLGSALSSPQALLRTLASQEGTWLVDGWNRIDPESRELLTRLRGLRSKARVVVASRDKPALEVDSLLELGPLSAKELEAHPGAYQATGGLPALVGAFLRGEPLEGVLEGRLEAISEEARAVYGALSLLETSNLATVRKALALGAREVAQALEELITAGLVEPSGTVRARGVARGWLSARPALETRLVLALVPLLPDLEAFPLYQQARALTDSSELPGMARAYKAWAEELLRRGFPQRAAETLAEVASDPELSLLRARALERAGQYKEALEALKDLPDDYEVLALKGTLLWRLGRLGEAKTMAEQALEGDSRARAEALNTLGHLSLAAGDFAHATGFFRRAANLWQLLGEDARWVGALNNEAMSQIYAGESAEELLGKVFASTKHHPAVQSKALLNLGMALEQRKEYKEAERIYLQAAASALEAGTLDTSARAWNNVGVVYHFQQRKEEAEEAYRQALALARQAGETLIMAMALGNLAELLSDVQALEEAILLLEKSGHQDMAERYKAELKELKSHLGNGHTSSR